MRIKFDSERKEKENTILQKNFKIQEMKLNEQKTLRNFIIILLGISLLLIGVITNRYQAKRKSNQLLAQRNQVITRQKEELSRSERKIRAILDNAGVGISLVNRDGNFIRVNGKWADMLQHPLDQILNKPFLDFSHPEDKMKARGYFEAMLSREINDFHIETRYFRQDKTSFWGDLSATSITSVEGDVESVIFMVTDISDNKQAEFSLRESEEKYRTLVENANYGIVITRDRMIKFVNSQFTKLSGYPQIKLIDSNLSNYIVPVSGDAVKLSKKGKTFETVLLPKIGQEIDVEISASEIFYGDHFADLLFIYDITEKKLLEKERIKNQELEFIGTLVAKIAEYFNHIFSGFIPAISLIKTSEETGLKIQRLLSEMEHSLGKVQELSKALLSLSKVRMTIQKLHLQEKLEDWIQQTKHAGMFKIKLNIPDNLWAIAANPEQIQIAFTELLNNYMKSAPPGKGLKIEAENIKVDEDSFTDLNRGKYIKLLITFQGKANQVKTKITDDFGLVFALVYAIIKKHSGVVWMKFGDKESGPTVFEIYLPAYESSTKNIKINERQKEG
jgi:PAS domain S-box-containing protein